VVNELLGKIWPEACVLCALPAGTQALCSGCARDLSWSIEVCTRCSLPLPAGPNRLICGQCLLNPPRFSACVSAGAYQYPADRLISTFKYGDAEWLARALGPLLADRLQQLAAKNALFLPELIIPVPLHYRRLQQRGFNQASSLASVIGKRLRIPISNRTVARKKATQEQTGLSVSARHNNVRGAFFLREAVAGKSIAILDDVITTTSTVNELTRVLLKGNARAVQCWSIARTVR
jgi:ComF family protein